MRLDRETSNSLVAAIVLFARTRTNKSLAQFESSLDSMEIDNVDRQTLMLQASQCVGKAAGNEDRVIAAMVNLMLMPLNGSFDDQGRPRSSGLLQKLIGLLVATLALGIASVSIYVFELDSTSLLFGCLASCVCALSAIVVAFYRWWLMVGISFASGATAVSGSLKYEEGGFAGDISTPTELVSAIVVLCSFALMIIMGIKDHR